MANGDTKTEALLNILGNGGDASSYKGCCNTKTQSYILDAIDRVQSVEDEVEELKNNPDVVDIVDTYADLQAYDTSTLTDKDIVRVLSDSTHSGNSTYYRWNATTNQFDFVGEIEGGGGEGGAKFIELTTADYNWNSSTGATGTPNCVALWLLPSGIYKGPADSRIEVKPIRTQSESMGAGFPSYAVVKQYEASNNRSIVTFVDGSIGTVIEYYSIDADGLNYSTKRFPNVVQTTGTSTTDVMSQKAVTDAIAAAGGVKTLTSADYNYKYGGGEPDGVALWLLDEGQYIIESGTDYYLSIGSKSYTQQNTGVVILVKPTGTGSSERGGFIIQEQNRTLLVSRIDSTGNNGNQDEFPRKLANNLYTNTSGYALDARQGKALNDKIGGDLSTLVTTDKSSLIAAINEVAQSSGATISNNTLYI